MAAKRRCSSSLPINVRRRTADFRIVCGARIGKVKQRTFTLRGVGQRIPTVTWRTLILSLPQARFRDFLIICNGLRRVYLIPC